MLEGASMHEGVLDIKGKIIMRLLNDLVLVWIFSLIINLLCVALNNLFESQCFSYVKYRFCHSMIAKYYMK